MHTPTLLLLIISILGFIPNDAYADEIEYENLVFKIHKLSNNKIDEVILRIVETEENLDEDDEYYDDY